MNLKRKDKIKLIPYGFYCYDYKDSEVVYCPFFTYRKTNLGLNMKKDSFEYCKYIGKFLSIQDRCKDCGKRYRKYED